MGVLVFVELVSIGNLFADNYFKPAKVQRQYVWGEEEGREFLYDLIEAFEKGRHKKYFLGPVIFCEVINGPNRVVEVFDGQQRLTTLTIMLCVLSGFVDQPLREQLQSSTREWHGNEWRPRIDLQTQGGSLTSLIRGNRFRYHQFVRADWRIQKIAEALRVGLIDVSEKAEFAKWVLRCVSLSVLWADSVEEGLAMFLKANTRGIQLSWVENVKAVVFDAIAGDGVAAREAQWYRVGRDSDAEFEGLVRSIAAMWSTEHEDFAGLSAIDNRMSGNESRDPYVKEFFNALEGFKSTGQRLNLLRFQNNDPAQEDLYLIQLLALEYFHWKPLCYIGCRDLKGDAKLRFLRSLREAVRYLGVEVDLALAKR